MIAIWLLVVRMLCDCFKSRQQLEAEIVVLRHQLNILQRQAARRPHLRWADRALFIWLYRRCPRILHAITIVRPETVVRWHRMGFAAYWRWKSFSPGGRPRIAKEVRDPIRRMSLEPAVGRHQDPRRTAQARHPGGPIHGFDLNGAAAGSATADLEDLRAQSHGGDCID